MLEFLYPFDLPYLTKAYYVCARINELRAIILKLERLKVCINHKVSPIVLFKFIYLFYLSFISIWSYRALQNKFHSVIN